MNRRHVKLLLLLNVFTTVYYGLRLRTTKLVLMRQSRAFIKGEISLGGLLVVGNTWGHRAFKQTFFSVAQGGQFRTDGDVKFFEGSEVRITKTGRLTISSGYLNEGCIIECFSEIRIGHNATFARNVIIRDSDGHHLIDRPDNTAPIIIGDNVWIGMNSIILKNVTIGDGAMIAAGSVVNRDVASGTLVAGVPARYIRSVSWK